VVRWRLTALVLLAFGVGLPLAWPFFDLLGRQELLFLDERLFLLAGNTICLVAGTLLLALPVGVLGAALLYRTDLPLAGLFRYFTVLALFVPLPVLTTAWQAALGSGPGSLLALWRGDEGGRPWAEGLAPAIWIHAQAALPWVIVIVGNGLRWVEAELEEDALLATGVWTVLWRVTLPRCRGSILAAAVWVALQVSTECAVAELMLVGTVAAEVYTQFTGGGGDRLARAVAVALPWTLLTSAGAAWLLLRLEHALPPLASLHARLRTLALGRARWPALVFVAATVGLLAGLPLLSLVIKTGTTARDAQWSAEALVHQLATAARSDGVQVARSLLTNGLSAVLTATVALVLCWLAVDAPRFRRVLFVGLALAWSLPGPIVGVGLKETIQTLVTKLPWEPLALALWDGPSPVPVMWAHLLRFLPCAVAILWPVVRALPAELRDSLRTEGARPWQEFLHLVIPLAFRAWCAIVVVTAAQAVGEIGAIAMRVETPGWDMFAHVLFIRMHYGLQSDVSALCLLLILVLVAGSAAIWLVVKLGSLLLTARAQIT
jgi:iron(III) transport system permease protein